MTDDELEVYRYTVGRWDDGFESARVTHHTPRWFHTMEEVIAYQETLDQDALHGGEYYLTDMADPDSEEAAEEWARQHVESHWHMRGEPHHRLAQHLASAHGEDEVAMLDIAFDLAVECHEQHHGLGRGQ